MTKKNATKKPRKPEPPAVTENDYKNIIITHGDSVSKQICSAYPGKKIMVDRLNDQLIRKDVFDRLKQGQSYELIHQRTGVSTSTIGRWNGEFKRNGTW